MLGEMSEVDCFARGNHDGKHNQAFGWPKNDGAFTLTNMGAGQ